MDSPRHILLDAALRLAPFEGWTDRTLAQAVETAGMPPGSGALYVPDGPLGLIDLWHHRTLDHVREALAARGLANMRVRDRIEAGVLLALEAIGRDETAMRRALARLALPDAAGQGPRQLWEMADVIWASIGDTSTDANYYSKRAVLSVVIASSLRAWLADPDPDKRNARAHLDRRLDDVLRFEAFKARARGLRAVLPDPAALLGGLRYGRGGPRGDTGYTPLGPLGPFRPASTKSRRRRSR